ncbi:protein BatD [Ferrimonas sediminicola]|uniref:Protein BatD n=1 Tax=Ferrimonas sediminicola TaxID=2569538 RepID=A0A4U1BC00_9GAMM|nr:BatD family protein [Ferrimonas sediminicola]TKB48173.1 protein BatD [Ferrimonas sediminicola]
MRGWILLVAMMPLLALANVVSINRSDPGVEVRLELLQAGPYYVNGRLPVKLTLALDGRLWGRVALRQPGLKDALVIHDPGQEFDRDTEKQVDRPKEILTRQFEIYPRRQGTLVLAPIEMQLVYYDRPSDRYRQVTVASAPLSIDVRRPPEWPEGRQPLVTPQLTLSHSAIDAEDDLKVGDAVTLTYSIMASGVDAMLLPSLSLPELEGASQYRRPAQLQNYRNSRGEPVGRRTEQVTYIVQRPGTFTISPQRVSWWNLDHSRLESAEVAAVTWKAGGPLPPWFYRLWHQRRAQMLLFLVVLSLLSLTSLTLALKGAKGGAEERRLRRSYWRSFSRQDPLGMSRVLEAYVAGKPGGHRRLRQGLEGESLAALDAFYLWAYGTDGAPPTRAQARQLLRAVCRPESLTTAPGFSLKLNCGSQR